MEITAVNLSSLLEKIIAFILTLDSHPLGVALLLLLVVTVTLCAMVLRRA